MTPIVGKILVGVLAAGAASISSAYAITKFVIKKNGNKSPEGSVAQVTNTAQTPSTGEQGDTVRTQITTSSLFLNTDTSEDLQLKNIN